MVSEIRNLFRKGIEGFWSRHEATEELQPSCCMQAKVLV
jgi:hypothetical protein